jgi:APA family basic amino acid/polyamine antiporter
VAFEDGHYSQQAVATAVKLAARRRRGIHILATISVPQSAPIDAPLPEQEAKALEVIDQARVLGGRRVTGHWEKVRPGEAGRRIVDEAKSMRARAIVMPLTPSRRGGAPVFGRSHETVLEARPCRVIIEAAPREPSRIAA